MKFHTFINKYGTTSLFCDDIGDIYYSFIGAYEEAMQKFVLPLSEENFSRDLKVLDICYGLGFNSKTFVNYLINEKNFKNKIEIDAIDIDKKILALSLLHNNRNINQLIHNKFSLSLLRTSDFKNETEYLLNNEDFSCLINNASDSILKLYQNKRINYKKNAKKSTFVHNIYYQPHSKRLILTLISLKNIKINFKINDLLSVLPKLEQNSYDFIFHDGFSPSKQPELWSEDVFSYIYKILKPGGKVLTYTRSKQVRKNMILSGLIVFDVFDDMNNVVGTMAKKII